MLRLVAAWSVLVLHSFALAGQDEPLHQIGTTLGSVGVLVFGVSGLLIRRSWENDPSTRVFWIKRALRLLPALATVGLITAFVLGPVVTSLGRYFSSWETWIYPVRITLLFPFGAELPGVFDHGYYPGAVNGPLWSLPVGVFAYFLLVLLGTSGLLARRAVSTAFAALGLVWAAVWVPLTSDAVGATQVIAAFAVGAAVYSWRDRLVPTWPVALALIPLWVVTGLGPEPLRVVTWTLASVYILLLVRPNSAAAGSDADALRRRVVWRLHLGVPRCSRQSSRSPGPISARGW